MRLSDSRGFFRQIFILLVLAVSAAVVYVRWWPNHTLVRWSGQLETAVNHQLVEAGVHDSLVLSQVRHEHSSFGVVWVETERQIAIDNPSQIFELSGRLAPIAHRYYCLLSRQTIGEATVMDIGLGPLRFQRLIFLKERKPSALAVPPPVTESPTSSRPQVAFVIDDVAASPEPMDRFATLGVPLTFAILPRDRHCADLANKADHMNFAVIMHLPMEPIDLAHNNPGSAGLYLRMTPQELHEQFTKDIRSIPHLQGMNNHMGSAFTQDESKMSTIMPWIKESGLFFLDSKTTPKSVACRVAKKFDVPCQANETFLDNKDDQAAIQKQLDIVLALALRHHHTIAIGHYRRKHLVEALADKLPEFKAKGVDVVTLSTFYK